MLEKEVFDNRPKVARRKLNVLPENPEQKNTERKVGLGRFPSWLHRSLPKGAGLAATEEAVRDGGLHTVCEEAKCPNLLECWSKKTATFLVMGKSCTRSCGFCDIDHAKMPPSLDRDEPKKVAESVVRLGLNHAVITMVARDDLSDGGAAHLAKVVHETRRMRPIATIEVLTSDFEGNFSAIDKILSASPEIFNHNLETVRSLTPRVRHKATYDRTLDILHYVKQQRPDLLVKSGLMLGLGESEEEVFQTVQDLASAGCDVITMGQYLQPNRKKLRVKAFISPEKFDCYAEYGKTLGVRHMYCGPFVRSSYNAAEVLEKVSRRP